MTGVLLLGGPTASGKTALAIALANRFDAEIVSADSRQIYRGMPIGTAAPSEEERNRAVHHLVAFLDPGERYSAARFSFDALAVIEAIHARGRRAIVAGGTGFYLRALSGDVKLSAAYDPALRARLERERVVHPAPVLHDWLRALDPRRAQAVAPNDPYRIVRALEIALAPGPAAPDPRARSLKDKGIPCLKLWLDLPMEQLEERIAVRVDAMLRAGFVEEAQRVGARAVASDAVGYPLALAYLAGMMTEGELRAALIRATRRYARRQRTWFRGEPGARAIDAHDVESARDEIIRAAAADLAWT